MGFKHPITKSFLFAFEGIKTALKKEPNLRIHLIIAAVAIFAAMILGFNLLEWVILIITIGFVLTLELVNTALESIVNLVSPEIKEEAKVAKDVSAAAVFIAAAVSVLIGLFLFLPKIY